MIDDEHHDFVMQWRWRAKPGRWGDYVCRHTKGTTIYLHREIACAIKGEIVDHIDNNPLNNQSANLRLVNNSQNQMNRRVNRGKKSSKYIGVTPYRNGRWRAQICKNRQQMWLGIYDTEEDAAIVRDVAAQLIHGEYANLNGV